MHIIPDWSIWHLQWIEVKTCKKKPFTTQKIQTTKLHSSRMYLTHSLPYRGSVSGRIWQRPPRKRPPEQRPPWTETPGQRPPGQRSLDRDPLDGDLLDRDPLDRDHLNRDSPDRDPPGQRLPGQRPSRQRCPGQKPPLDRNPSPLDRDPSWQPESKRHSSNSSRSVSGFCPFPSAFNREHYVLIQYFLKLLISFGKHSSFP